MCTLEDCEDMHLKTPKNTTGSEDCGQGPAAEVLRRRGVDTVLLAGLLANCCVESSMRSAYERGYIVYTLEDCVRGLCSGCFCVQLLCLVIN